MDFFGEQRTRTQRSLLLYGLFFLIVFAHMAVALGVMALLLTLFTGGIYYWALVLVIIWTLGSFAGGSFLEYRRLKAGGRAIAQRVGAVRLFIDHSQDAWEHSEGIAHQHEPIQKVRYSARHIAVRDERDFPPVYRRYHEIAQQLAIASGLSMPILYVLPDEQGINGFVAGRHSQDMVLVVTQGALDKLSDEALYGLIGHEYGHILHGDATFNLQLMVVLAGLQILYDWSDPIGNSNYFDNAVNQNLDLSQKSIDNHARSTEAKTASFTTHSEWVAYWQSQSQNQQSTAKSQSKWLQNKPVVDIKAPRSVWTLLLHGLSFSSMASAQLIKHSFNRERELLADATSVQLTRSPAIMETLKAIHQDSLGSRLTGITDINGLSHFFFASSGTDLGDVSWFATHPSLSERMGAINANAYHKFAVQVAKEKRINQQKIKEIYEQRRLGDVEKVKTNSLSIDKKENTNKQSLHAEPLSTQALNSELEKEEEKGLDFVVTEDVVIDGRLQVQSQDMDIHERLKPWQAKPDSDLPSAALISIDDIEKVSLPQYVLNHSHHPLGAQALVEAVMLCHQGQALATTSTYDLADIWYEVTTNKTDDHRQAQILPHAIDHKLIEIVASIDRRLDSALITTAIKNLSQHNLSESVIAELRLKHESSHSNESYQYYSQQKKCRMMLMRYQQGITELFNGQLTADLSIDLADKMAVTDKDFLTDSIQSESADAKSATSWTPSILSLWQALHLQQLLPILSTVLSDEPSHVRKYESWQYTLRAGTESIYAQLDPSGQVFARLNDVKRTMLILLAYRLSKDVKGQMTSALDSSMLNYNDASVAHYIVDLRRHARLIDIDLAAISNANLQWLLLTAQNLNSIQLLALIETVPVFIASTVESSVIDAQNTDNYRERQQDSSQIDYNDTTGESYTYNNYQQWLSTLHTVMLHDTIVSQDEYDCLMLLAERWLGVRKLF
ncbi:M48 family metalloprotease [Psychrobacter sp. NG25]|uniref:M48 family metalloprotease n=1 Tax=Psychrobacter sp. NG25 TaxID=2782005 RepID=UPI0018831806|nr:M48 family metalloprotease [Psychrobacter sp. NG25]MBF0657950.1 M48 family metalloprotease [Psychrobacter sp. NG25]